MSTSRRGRRAASCGWLTQVALLVLLAITQVAGQLSCSAATQYILVPDAGCTATVAALNQRFGGSGGDAFTVSDDSECPCVLVRVHGVHARCVARVWPPPTLATATAHREDCSLDLCAMKWACAVANGANHHCP